MCELRKKMRKVVTKEIRPLSNLMTGRNVPICNTVSVLESGALRSVVQGKIEDQA